MFVFDFTYHLPFRHFNLKHLNGWRVYTVVSGVKGDKGRGRWARKRTFTTILKRRRTMRRQNDHHRYTWATRFIFSVTCLQLIEYRGDGRDGRVLMAPQMFNKVEKRSDGGEIHLVHNKLSPAGLMAHLKTDLKHLKGDKVD